MSATFRRVAILEFSARLAVTLASATLGGSFTSVRFKVSVDVQNVGQRPGEEIVQFYVQDPVCSVDRPEKELKAFARVRLQPNEVKRITVDLGPRALAFYDVNTKDWVVEPGEFRVMVGASSQDLRAAGSFLVQ